MHLYFENYYLFVSARYTIGFANDNAQIQYVCHRQGTEAVRLHGDIFFLCPPKTFLYT